MKTGIFTMKRVLAFTIAVVASMTMIAGGTQPVMTAQNASAESQAIKNNKKKISSAKDKISELEQKQADLDKQINSTKDDISKEEENQKAIQEQIETVQETILTLEDSITDLETEISDLEEAIAKSEIKIKNKRTEIENGVVDFKQRLRAMYVAGNSSYTDILIGSTDFYDMLMKIELVKRVANHDNTMIDGLVELKGEYESQEAELEANKTELETNKATLEEQKAYHTEQKEKLDDLYAKSQAVIDQLEEDKAAYEANKEQINKEQEDFEAQLQKLYKEQEQIKKKEEEERKKKEEEERKRREEEERRQQQQQQNNNGNSSPSNANGNTSNSGQSSTNNGDYNYTDKSQFTWPVPGYYHISYGVGWRWGAYHKGIDIWSPGIRAKQSRAAAAHHLHTFNHVGRNLLQTVYPRQRAEDGTRVDENLRIRPVQSVDAHLLISAVLAVVLHTHTRLEVQPLRQTGRVGILERLDRYHVYQRRRHAAGRLVTVGRNHHPLECHVVLANLEIQFQRLALGELHGAALCLIAYRTDFNSKSPFGQVFQEVMPCFVGSRPDGCPLHC